MSRPIEDAGGAMSIQVVTAFVRGPDEIEAALQSAAQQTDSGIIVIPDSLAVVHSDLVIDLVARLRLPAIYAFRLFSLKGGLLTCGLDVPAIYRQAAEYVDRILRGTKPSDLPVQAPTKFDLVSTSRPRRPLAWRSRQVFLPSPTR